MRHCGMLKAAIQKVFGFNPRSSALSVSSAIQRVEVFVLSLECITFCKKRQSVFICGYFL